MKKIIALSSLILLASLGIAAKYYDGPDDERSLSVLSDYDDSLGWYAQHLNAVAVADVIEDGTNHAQSVFGYVKIRVVNALYGCTNGQELVLLKMNLNPFEMKADPEDWAAEFWPTNNSRIGCAILAMYPGRRLPPWTPKVWKRPPESETIVASTQRVFVIAI
jgi:hypothetical protein